MKVKMSKSLIALVSIALAAVFGAIVFLPEQPAMANSADRHFYGTDSQGIIVATEACPIEVVKEELTFDIYKNNLNEGMSIVGTDDSAYNREFYKKQVSAKYTFFNPSDLNITADLVFPFGYYEDYKRDNTDFSAYNIYADGEPVSKTLRGTYLAGYSYNIHDAFIDLDEMRSSLLDDYAEDDFYKEGDKVTKYTLRFSCGAADEDAVICLNWSGMENRRLVVDSHMHYDYKNNNRSKYISYFNGQEYVFYVIEDEPDANAFLSRFCAYSDNTLTTELSPLISETVAVEQGTVRDLFCLYKDEACLMSDYDWYNATLARVKDYNRNSRRALDESDFDIGCDLMCWFEYTLSFAPDKTLVNEVIAPLYPDGDGYYVPPKYIFNYYLSPASCWADFKALSVRVNTDMYLMDNTLEEVDFGDGYYAWDYDELPEGELSFTLCEVENPDRYTSSFGNAIVAVVVILCVGAALVLLVPAVGVIITVVIVKKKR